MNCKVNGEQILMRARTLWLDLHLCTGILRSIANPRMIGSDVDRDSSLPFAVLSLLFGTITGEKSRPRQALDQLVTKKEDIPGSRVIMT